jgi:hypothetical protein
MTNPHQTPEGSQRDEPDAVIEVVDHLGRHLQRQARLARPAGPRQRQQPQLRPQELLPHGGHLALAADQGRRLRGKVVGARIQGDQRREGLRQPRHQELEHPLGPAEVFEPALPQIPQRGPVRQGLPHQTGGDLREQRLAPVAGGPQAGTAVDGTPIVVACPQVGRPGVQRQPDA